MKIGREVTIYMVIGSSRMVVLAVFVSLIAASMGIGQLWIKWNVTSFDDGINPAIKVSHNLRQRQVQLTPTWYIGDWWTYHRVWDIDLGNLGFVYLVDNCTYVVEEHITVETIGGSEDVYNISVASINVDGQGKVYISDIDMWLDFYINEDASFIQGYTLIRRSDLAMVRMFVYVHINAGLTEGGGIANLDLNITLEPSPPEEDYDFPLFVGDKWHQNWTLNVYGDYYAEVPQLPPEDSYGNIDEVIQMDADYECKDITNVDDPHGGTMAAFYIESVGTNLSDTPGGKQLWWFAPGVKWFQKWYITDVNLGDMGGSEGKINSIEMTLMDYGEGSGTTFQAYIEDGNVVDTIKGGKVLIQATEDSNIMIPEMGLKMTTTYNSDSGFYEALFQLPESDDNTPSESDYGSFGIIIESKTAHSKSNDYVVRTVSFKDCNLRITSVDYDDDAVMLAGSNVEFIVHVYNDYVAFVGTPIKLMLKVDNTTAVISELRGINGMSDKSVVINWIASSGHHNLTFVIDGEDEVNETNENDNIYVITVDVDIPPHAEFFVNRTECYTFEPIEFNASLSYDTDGRIVSYEWDFDGDGKFEATGMVVSYIYMDGKPKDEGGIVYNATLYVTDDLDGVSTYSIPITVYNRPPTPSLKIHFSINGREFEYTSFDNTIIIPPNVEITFDATGSTDMDGTITSYEWDFGGDTFATNDPVIYKYWYEEMSETQCKFKVMDDDGEYSSSVDFTIKVSNMPPNITVNVDKTEVKTFETVSISASVFDPDGEIRYIWWDYDCDYDSDGDGINDNDWDSTEEYISISYEDGTNDGKEYRVKVSAKDDKNAVTEVTITIKVYNQPPNAVLPSPTKTNIVMGKEFTFDLNDCSDLDGTVTEYYIDFGDGTESGWTSSSKISHTYNKNGTYMVTLKVKDDDGAIAVAVENYTVKFKNERPIIVSVDIPKNAEVGENITLKIIAKDPDGTIARYEISWGDDTTDSGENTTYTHAYVSEGKYTVTIRVYDDIGDYATETYTVTVLAPSDGTGSGSKKVSNQGDYTLALFAIVIIILIVALVIAMKLRNRGGKKGNGHGGSGSPELVETEIYLEGGGVRGLT